MVSYFARHEVDKQGSSWETYGKGRQAWDGWGGDPGRRWAALAWHAGWMQRSEHSSVRPNNPAAADTRADQHCNRPEPGKHHRSNNQHLKRGETDAKKIANSPHNSLFKISSLQLPGDPCRSL